MKKILLLILLLIPFNVKAESSVTLFYGKECPYCQREEEQLKILKYQLKDNLKINKYEVWHNKKNNELLSKTREKFNDEETGVPYIVIKSKHYTGYNEQIFKDVKQTILDDLKSSSISMPLIGKVDKNNVKKVSFISGLLDGINLNSLWIILFLSGIMLCIYNNKKRVILSNIFMISSFITYMLFILSNIEFSIWQTMIIRSLIAIVAILIGAVAIDAYLKIKVPKKSILQMFESLFKKNGMKIYLFFIIIVGIISTFALVNSSASTPLLLKILTDNSVLSIILYGFGYLIINLICVNVLNLIIKELIMENTIGTYSRLISGIIMIVSALIVLYIPSIFMMI